MTRCLTHRLPTLLAATALLATGCADLGTTRTGDEIALDGGLSATDSGPALDLGSSPDGAAPPAPGYSGIPASDADTIPGGGERDDGEFASGARSCFDGEDNDDDGALDCQDAACFTVASCCVSSGRAGCCTAPEALTRATFDDCADPASCVSDATTFGSPEPFVTAEGLAMGGDALYDSGLLVETPLDLRGERITLQATFRDTTTCTGCLDGAAFGVTSQSSLDDEDHVEPLVALQRNAGGDVRLRAGPRTLATFAVTEGEPFGLLLRPDGVGEVTHAGSRLEFRHTVSRVVHAIGWGYSSNPSASATEGVFLDDLAVDRSRCGAADGWRDRAALAGASARRLTSVAVAVAPEGTPWVVLDDMDGLSFGIRTEAGTFEPRALGVAAIPWGTGARDWGLTHDGADLWLTFLADEGGATALGRARLNGDTFEPEPAPYFRPGQPLARARWSHEADNELIVAEVAGAIALYGRGPAVPGGDWRPLPSDLPGLTEGAEHPHLLRTPEGVWLVHVAKAVGTRWVIELFASDELVAWRPMGTVLAGSGDLDDFDGLGTSAPVAFADGDALQLLYVGHGPARQALGGARRWLGAVR